MYVLRMNEWGRAGEEKKNVKILLWNDLHDVA